MANILVCDDSALIRLQLKDILNNGNHNIVEATNFKQIKLNSFSNDIKLDEIDVIFLDVYLGDISGLKILKYLSKNYPDIPVLMISIDNKRETIMRALKLGATDYILKPFDKIFIIDKLNTILSTTEFSNNKKPENITKKLSSLENSLSMEINRTLRNELAFTLAKFKSKDEEKINELKETTTSMIRDIDRAFPISEDIFVLLLPLTNKEGFEKLKDRLEKGLETSDSIDEITEITTTTFPDDITEKLDYKKSNKYKKDILHQLNLY